MQRWPREQAQLSGQEPLVQAQPSGQEPLVQARLGPPLEQESPSPHEQPLALVPLVPPVLQEVRLLALR